MRKKPRRVSRPQARNKLRSVFSGGVYVGKNTSRAACVELSAFGGQPRHVAERSLLEKVAKPLFRAGCAPLRASFGRLWRPSRHTLREKCFFRRTRRRKNGFQFISRLRARNSARLFRQAFIIHCFFYFPQKMICGHQCIQIRYYRFFPCILFPLFHKNTPVSIIIQETRAFE